MPTGSDQCVRRACHQSANSTDLASAWSEVLGPPTCGWSEPAANVNRATLCHWSCYWARNRVFGKSKSRLDAITQPYYLLRPAQVLRRLRFWYRRPPLEADSSIALPWGLNIRCRPNEEIGYSLHTTGIYDLLLTEMICRSVGRGETVIDAGANIGYATSLMAMLAGLRGRVYAFEPHPRIFLELKGNVESWLLDPRAAAVELCESALSESSGTATLREPDCGFEANRGMASLDRKAGVSGKAYTVKKQRLDEICRLMWLSEFGRLTSKDTNWPPFRALGSCCVRRGFATSSSRSSLCTRRQRIGSSKGAAIRFCTSSRACSVPGCGGPGRGTIHRGIVRRISWRRWTPPEWSISFVQAMALAFGRPHEKHRLTITPWVLIPLPS